jgi:hypothetical protein
MITTLVNIYSFSEISTQLVIWHYCTPFHNGISQCTLFDGDSKESRLIGVAYFVTREYYDALTKDEKLFWYPNFYSVKSGLLVAPGLTSEDEWFKMKFLENTYSLVIDTWHHHKKYPMIGNGLQYDKEIEMNVLKKMDDLLKGELTYNERKLRRRGLEEPLKDTFTDLHHDYYDTSIL